MGLEGAANIPIVGCAVNKIAVIVVHQQYLHEKVRDSRGPGDLSEEEKSVRVCLGNIVAQGSNEILPHFPEGTHGYFTKTVD